MNKIKNKPKTLAKFYKDHFMPHDEVSSINSSQQSCQLTDEQVIQNATRAGNGKKFKRLFAGDTDGYPSRSEADLALCSILSFWTGNDANQMDRLFRRSSLIRKKWDEQHGNETYGQMTIRTSLQSTSQAYDGILHKTEALDVDTLCESVLKTAKDNRLTAISSIIRDEKALNDLARLSIQRGDRFELLLSDLKIQGIASRELESLRKAVKAVKKTVNNGTYDYDMHEVTNVRAILPGAPVSSKLIIPREWSVNETGVFRRKLNNNGQCHDEKVAPLPVLIQSHLKNIVDSTEGIRIAWPSQGGWEVKTVSRLDIADAKSITKLAEFGCPVTSVTASRSVEYLAAFEAENRDHLPRAFVTHQIGWQGEDRDSFLWGKNLIMSDGTLKFNVDIDKMAPEEWPPSMIFFKGHDQGEDQIAKSFTKKGKFRTWLQIETIIGKYPLITFSVFASLVPPLLDILGVPNFTVDWAFPTSRGKTTTLKVAGSCWGNPDMKKEHSVVGSWNSTRVFLERKLTVLRNLPLILDDTKTAKYPQLVSQFLYDAFAGQGRGRGSIQGIRPTGSWSTVVLSSGESKAVNFTAGDGGTHARVLSLWGSPFGKKNKEKAKTIRILTKIIHKNYGHAGWRFISYLMKHRDDWGKYRTKYNEIINYYQEQAGSNEVALRQCEYFAVIHLAASLAKKALGLTIKYKNHLGRVFKKVIAETSEADRARAALEEVLSWIVSNKSSFWPPNNDDGRQPLTGWLGVWNPCNGLLSHRKKLKWELEAKDSGTVEKGPLKSVAIMPHHLDKYLKDHGYESKSILRTWKDKGWLDIDRDKKGLTKKVSIAGERTRCYVISNKIIAPMNR